MAKETLIRINEEGIMCVQHQVLLNEHLSLHLIVNNNNFCFEKVESALGQELFVDFLLLPNVV